MPGGRYELQRFLLWCLSRSGNHKSFDFPFVPASVSSCHSLPVLEVKRLETKGLYAAIGNLRDSTDKLREQININ
jgi:hypothetical protein